MRSPPPQPGLIDTQLLIEIRSGHPYAHQFAVAMLTFATLHVSELTGMALVAQCRSAGELQRNLAFLGNSQVHAVTSRVSRRAFQIISRLPPPSPMTADDAIVAATARFHKLPLYTLDPARFAVVPGLSATRPY